MRTRNIVRISVVVVALLGGWKVWRLTLCACSTPDLEMRREGQALADLVLAQRGWFLQHQRYTTSTESLSAYRSGHWRLRIVAATDSGWSALIDENIYQPVRCAVFVGKAVPPLSGLADGRAGCRVGDGELQFPQ